MMIAPRFHNSIRKYTVFFSSSLLFSAFLGNDVLCVIRFVCMHCHYKAIQGSQTKSLKVQLVAPKWMLKTYANKTQPKHIHTNTTQQIPSDSYPNANTMTNQYTFNQPSVRAVSAQVVVLIWGGILPYVIIITHI